MTLKPVVQRQVPLKTEQPLVLKEDASLGDSLQEALPVTNLHKYILKLLRKGRGVFKVQHIHIWNVIVCSSTMYSDYKPMGKSFQLCVGVSIYMYAHTPGKLDLSEIWGLSPCLCHYTQQLLHHSNGWWELSPTSLSLFLTAQRTLRQVVSFLFFKPIFRKPLACAEHLAKSCYSAPVRFSQELSMIISSVWVQTPS